MAKKPKPPAPTEAVSLTPAELDALTTYLAAHRAATLAEALLKNLKPTVLRLAKKHPGLTLDGAHIGSSYQMSWSYDDENISYHAEQLALYEAEARAAYKADPSNTIARRRLTEFPTVRDNNPAHKLEYPPAAIASLRTTFASPV